MFKNIVIILMICAIAIYARPQKYLVYFEDKGISEKSDWTQIAAKTLSQRSLQRRQHANIPLDWYDLPVEENYVQQVENLGAEIVHNLKWFNAVSVICEPETLALIRYLPFVSRTEKIRTLHAKLPPRIALQRVAYVDSFYGSAFQQADMLKVPFMHSAGYMGEGIIIGILDSGFDIYQTAFDSVRTYGRILSTYDFVHNDSSVGYDTSANDWDQGGYGHGTMTFSCIAAYIPGTMVGVAPKSSFVLAKTEIIDTLGGEYERQIEEDNWAAAVQWMDSVGVDIISSSLGYYDFQGDSQDYSFEQMNGDFAITTVAADFAASRGIAVFNSAGNERVSGWGHILAPADGDSVCAVGATDFAGNYASFSSPGPTADGRIKPDLSAPGAVITVWNPDENAIGYSSGTSFSCPITAGTAALVLQARRASNPELSGWDLIEILKESADQTLSPDNDYGWGIVKAPVAAGIMDGIYGMVSNSNSGQLLPDIPVIIGTDTFFTDVRGIFFIPIPKQDSTITIRLAADGYFYQETTFTHRESQIHRMQIPLTPVVEESAEILCYPNPFTDSLTICWRENDNQQRYAYIDIFSPSGELVRQLPEQDFIEYGHIIWDATNDHGKPIAPGIYFVLVQTESKSNCCSAVQMHKFKVLYSK
ncbi:hypothetical protein DRQ33_01690 [bacterium]|nr:MAG: hypothetical protein DRQ33_01690 [bacterium]